MRNAIIIHGMPSKEGYYSKHSDSPSNGHRLPRIQKELLRENILAQTPEMPHPYEPDYEKRKVIFESYPINKDTILIGHSCGAGFILRYLSENDIQVGGVILVAPYINPEKCTEAEAMFSGLILKKDLYLQTQGITIFSSDNDMEIVQESIQIILENTDGIEVKEFHNYGHFCIEDMETREFPELKEYIINNF